MDSSGIIEFTRQMVLARNGIVEYPIVQDYLLGTIYPIIKNKINNSQTNEEMLTQDLQYYDALSTLALYYPYYILYSFIVINILLMLSFRFSKLTKQVRRINSLNVAINAALGLIFTLVPFALFYNSGLRYSINLATSVYFPIGILASQFVNYTIKHVVSLRKKVKESRYVAL